MNGTTSPISIRSVGYALLTQAVWLPLVVVDNLDSAHTKRLTTQRRIEGAKGNLPVDQLSQARWRTGFRLPGTGVLLNQPLAIANSGSDPLREPPISASVDDGSQGADRKPLFSPYRPGSLQMAPVAVSARRAAPSGVDPITRAFTRSELLGGSLSLDGLRSPLVPPLALAEQARYRASGDPLSPLPLSLRAPIRQAIQQLPGGSQRVQQAKVTHVPSARVRVATQVPVAIQPDGSVDILSRPDSPAVVDEIRDWSKRQVPSARNTVTPAVVNIHPMPEEAVRPSAIPADSVQSSAPSQAPEPSWTPVVRTEVSAVPVSSAPIAPPPPLAEPVVVDQVLP